MFTKMKAKISNAIKGREQSDDFINSKFKKIAGSRVTDFLKIRALINQEGKESIDATFAIQDDCKCSAITEFLKLATAENITFAKGPKSGTVLGISGESVPGFYAYHRS
ncbi:MAG: hypothetical protein WA160_12310 [Pseudobdellovibrio sp.]